MMLLLLNRGDQVDAMLAEFYNSKFNVGSVCPVLIRYLYYNIGLTLAHLRVVP